eukprot:932998-Pelagomonas_calceolata.AAC.1
MRRWAQGFACFLFLASHLERFVRVESLQCISITSACLYGCHCMAEIMTEVQCMLLFKHCIDVNPALEVYTGMHRHVLTYIRTYPAETEPPRITIVFCPAP